MIRPSLARERENWIFRIWKPQHLFVCRHQREAHTTNKGSIYVVCWASSVDVAGPPTEPLFYLTQKRCHCGNCVCVCDFHNSVFLSRQETWNPKNENIKIEVRFVPFGFVCWFRMRFRNCLSIFDLFSTIEIGLRSTQKLPSWRRISRGEGSVLYQLIWIRRCVRIEQCARTKIQLASDS